jgi:hypothetical protein
MSRELTVTYGSVAVDSVAAAIGANTAYTLENTNADGTAPDWIRAGIEIAIYDCTNPVNNGTFTVVSVIGLVLTVANAAGVVEAGSPGLVAFIVAGASNFHLHEKSKSNRAYKTATVDFDFVVTTTTEANFAARVLAAERAFRVPRQRVRIIQGAQTLPGYNPANAAGGNTGFNAEPSIEKMGDDFDSGRSRRYHVRIEVQLPADLPGQTGRQDSEVDLSYDASRIKTVTISGTYTALGSNGARAQYAAASGTYFAAVKTALGGTYDTVSESVISDDADKIVRFKVSFLEIIYSQSGSGLDNASIVKGVYNYRRQQVAPGDSDAGARRLETLEVDFNCSVDRNVTTDLNSLWNDTVKPYIKSQITSLFGATYIALVDARVLENKDGNGIHGTLTIQAAASDGGSLVQITRTTEVYARSGKLLVPVWNGNPYARHVYDGPADKIRTTTETKWMLGAGGAGGGGGPNSAAGSGGGGVLLVGIGAGGASHNVGVINFGDFQVPLFGTLSGASQSALVQAALGDPEKAAQAAAGGGESGWILMSDRTAITPMVIGLGGDQIEMQVVTREVIEAYVESAGGGGVGEMT